MKKISFLLIGILLCFIFVVSGCGGSDNIIRLNEVTHSIFYAPLYVAINKGYFSDEGLTIELTNGGGSDASMTALLSNSADIALLGPETSVYVANQGRQDLPVIFGQLTKRDGSFIIGRTADTNFNWSDLANKEILGGRRGGMPAMTLEYALKKNGLVNGTNITINYSVAFNNITSAFLGGTADYMTTFEPTGSTLEANNTGHILASVGEEAGEVPFTTFMATSSYIENNTDNIYKFLRAIIKGYNYTISANIDSVVDALMPSFTGTERSAIKSSLENYISIDAWTSTPIMTESAYNRLITIMRDAGQITTGVEFSRIVNNSYATKVLNEMSGL